MPEEVRTIDITPSPKALKSFVLQVAKYDLNSALRVSAVLEETGHAPTFAEVCAAAGIEVPPSPAEPDEFAIDDTPPADSPAALPGDTY